MCVYMCIYIYMPILCECIVCVACVYVPAGTTWPRGAAPRGQVVPGRTCGSRSVAMTRIYSRSVSFSGVVGWGCSRSVWRWESSTSAPGFPHGGGKLWRLRRCSGSDNNETTTITTAFLGLRGGRKKGVPAIRVDAVRGEKETQNINLVGQQITNAQ